MEKYLKGRGAQFNPVNRFEKHVLAADHVEGIDEPVTFSTVRQLIEESPSKIVNKVDSPDLAMPFSANPYQGCEHGCSYCYARNTHEFWGFSAGLDFEQKIIVKRNAPQLLEKNFQKRTWKAAPITLSGNTDCYQPIEKKLEITRKMLKVFLSYGNPVGVITKNQLIQRDLDILSDLAAEGLGHVYISITTLNERLRQRMEPRTATAANRLRVVESMASRNIPVGVMCAPMIPGLNHHEIPQLMESVANAGAQDVAYTVVRLNGAIKYIFKDWLDTHYQDRASKVWNQIKSMHGGQPNDSAWGRRMRGDGHIAEEIAHLFRICKEKHFKDPGLPEYNLTRFRRTGNLRLF